MSVTATSAPQHAAQRAAAAGAPPARRRRRLLRASTTPGKLRLLLVGLVAACLAWGVLAALTVSQHASAADAVVATDEPLSLDAQQIYQSLADADVTVSAGYLVGRTPPFKDRERYQHDVTVAAADLKAATAASGNSSIGASLAALTQALPVYTGYVEDGEIYNSLGFPAGDSFIEVASEEMQLTLLPAAHSVYAQENAQLKTGSAQATGLPLAVIAVVAGLVLAIILYRAQRWLSGRTHRTVNTGLLLTSAAGLAALVWLVVALASGRADLVQAGGHGSGPAETLAQADITALQARDDQLLNLISRAGDADTLNLFAGDQSRLDALLADASANSTAAGAGKVAAARSDADAWFAVNQRAQALDKANSYGAETQLVIGSGPGTAATLFGTLEGDLNAAIASNQAVFTSNAAAGQSAFTGLEAGIVVLAVGMAVGCAWGLSRRLAEYR
jgi:hypothetical protein